VSHGQREGYLGAARNTAEEVGVHVPKSGHQEFARRVDNAGRLGDPSTICRPHVDDACASDAHDLVQDESPFDHIDNRYVIKGAVVCAGRRCAEHQSQSK
jgi:hypothetical protein